MKIKFISRSAVVAIVMVLTVVSAVSACDNDDRLAPARTPKPTGVMAPVDPGNYSRYNLYPQSGKNPAVRVNPNDSSLVICAKGYRTVDAVMPSQDPSVTYDSTFPGKADYNGNVITIQRVDPKKLPGDGIGIYFSKGPIGQGLVVNRSIGVRLPNPGSRLSNTLYVLANSDFDQTQDFFSSIQFCVKK